MDITYSKLAGVGALFTFCFFMAACTDNQPPSKEEFSKSIHMSAEAKQANRQIMLDEASVVCEDGWAYLAGDDHDTHKSDNRGHGGPFVTPYLHGAVQGRCTGSISDPHVTWAPSGRE
jgi:hypothetical protein